LAGSINELLPAFIGLFAITFVSNASPFFGVSYTLLSVAFLLEIGVTPLGYVLVVVVTGTAAGTAKAVIYYGALGFRSKLAKNRNVILLANWLGKKSFYTALLIAAFIPVLPLDDYIYIGAGANKANVLPMLTVTVISKIAKSAFEIALELAGILKIVSYLNLFGLSSLDLSLILSVFFIALGIIVYKVNWQRFFPNKVNSGGGQR
jgi:hypothetical protein